MRFVERRRGEDVEERACRICLGEEVVAQEESVLRYTWRMMPAEPWTAP